MTPINVICLKCTHYIKDGICRAFPNGIPEEIINGENDHAKPLPDQDNSIVYEPSNELKT